MNMLRNRRESGQSLVEFALILPIFVLVLAGLFDLGRAVYAFNTISNASREAVRVAIVNQTTAVVEAEALKQAVSLGVAPADISIAQRFAPPIPCGPHCVPTVPPCPSPIGVGCLASVTVHYHYTAATPVIGQIIGPFTMTASTEMPVERTCPDPIPRQPHHVSVAVTMNLKGDPMFPFSNLRARRARREPQGQVLVIVAAGLLTIVAMTGIVIDGGCRVGQAAGQSERRRRGL